MSAAEVLALHWMDEDQDCVKCNRHFNRIAEFAAHQLNALNALKAAGYAVVELPDVTADERGRIQVSGTGIHVSYIEDEFSLWVWNSVRGSTLQKRFEASVGHDLAAAILAAESTR